VAARYSIPLEKITVLSRNENPYGPSPRVREALKGVQLHSYPDSRIFVQALSDYTGHPPEEIVVGAGMDEVISIMARLFLGRDDRALIPIPTYTYYALVVRLCGGEPVYRHRLAGFDVDPDVSLEKTKMIFLCSPNNPTGNALSEKTVRAIVERTEGVVFLDEAYAEFAEGSLLELVNDYDNLVVGRTLSKAFGLAGLRLGYAVAPQWIAEQYRRMAPLFSISSLSLAAGVAALRDLGYMRQTALKIISERERMRTKLGDVDCSQGNFLYLRTEEESSLVANRLLRQGIIVRDCSVFPGAGVHHLRVSVGRPEQNDLFLEAFRKG
jgi:histidinol-phosphate aminotransferase